MNGCIYRTKDGECDLYAEGGKYTAFCEMENCEGRKLSNADKIRSMTDEKLAAYISDVQNGMIAGKEKPGFCDICESTTFVDCKDCWLDWLKSPADKDGDENV